MTQPSNQVKDPGAENLASSGINRQDLRRRLKQQRAAIGLDDKHRWDEALAARLTHHVLQLKPRSLAVFWPIQSEPDLMDCFTALHAEGIQLALPIVVAKAHPLKFVPWHPGQAMEQDGYGIPMPLERSHEIMPECIIAPCVGFNKENFRLGYGGGFYDRTLAKIPGPHSIGIAYEVCRASFPADQYDIALQTIITEAASYYLEADSVMDTLKPDALP